LTVAAPDCIGSIETGRTPVTNRAVGARVVRILEAATRSMENQGELIELDLTEVGA